MNHVFRAFLWKFALIFFDDILVYSYNEQEHYKKLEDALKLLRDHKPYVKQSKCCFLQNEVEYLGHIIS